MEWKNFMGENFWRRIDHFVGLLPLAALFGLAAFSANVEIKDLDLWLHLAMGKFISLHHYVPDVDMLSSTIAGKPWVNHEWLFQVIVYQIFNAFGAGGLQIMQSGVVIATMFVLLILGYNRHNQLMTAFMLLLVFLVFQQRFTIRPDIFSLFFFSLYIYILALHIDKRWSLFALFVIQVLWTNTHGFFFFGPLFIAIGLMSEWIKRHVPLPGEWNESGRLTDEEYQRLKAVFVFVLLACLVNPLFIKGALYPIGVFFSLAGENKIFFQHIQELEKPVRLSTIFDSDRFAFYKLLILLSFVSFILNRRKIDISAFFFWLVFLIFSVKASRNTSFFAFAAYLVFVTNTVNVTFESVFPIRFITPKFQYMTSAILKGFLLVWILQFYSGLTTLAYFDFDKYEHKREFGGISLRNYPNKAVDFLIENNIEGNLFNDFNSGAYLLGRRFPHNKVFIDGRTEVYGAGFFNQYRRIWNEEDPELFKSMVERYQITIAFLNSVPQRIPKGIIQYLYKSPDWRLVYFNFDAAIFLKNVPSHQAVIEKHAIDLSTWKTEKMDLYRLAEERVSPYQYYYRAYTLESLDFDDAALEESFEALHIAPAYAEAYDLIGRIYAKRKDYVKAFEHFRLAATLTPDSKKIRNNLALCYSDMGRHDGAVKQYKKIMEMWPDDPRAYFLLSKAYVLNHEYNQAFDTLKAAHKVEPGDVKDLIGVGDLFLEHHQYPLAEGAYILAMETKKELATTHMKLGLTYKAMNDIPKAREAFQKTLAIEPTHELAKKELAAIP